MKKKASEPPRLTSLAAHPRSAPAIRRAKAIGGLVGFAVAVLQGTSAGLPVATVLLRGLELGLVGNLVAWAAAVVVWKRVLTAQAVAAVRARERRLSAPPAEQAE